MYLGVQAHYLAAQRAPDCARHMDLKRVRRTSQPGDREGAGERRAPASGETAGDRSDPPEPPGAPSRRPRHPRTLVAAACPQSRVTCTPWIRACSAARGQSVRCWRVTRHWESARRWPSCFRPACWPGSSPRSSTAPPLKAMGSSSVLLVGAFVARGRSWARRDRRCQAANGSGSSWRGRCSPAPGAGARRPDGAARPEDGQRAHRRRLLGRGQPDRVADHPSHEGARSRRPGGHRGGG
jgi:hypothetical protein